MAIFHFRMKKSKRGGKYIPPTAHLDYINRDEKYGKKQDLLFTEVRNLPEEFSDIKDFWECVEENERKNANLYRELEIALPREFSPEENKKIVDDFCEQLFGKDYVYNYAIHNPKSFDGNMQPHVHIMFYERKIDDIKRDKGKYFKRYNSKNPEKGGWEKDSVWTEKSKLKEMRKDWETHLNFELEKRGIEKVSSKSLKDQRRDAENNKDYEKMYLLNRPAISIKGEILYKKESELTDKEKAQKRIFEKNRVLKSGTELMKKILKKIRNLQQEYWKIKGENIEELEALEKIRDIENQLNETNKKLKKERIENTVYNLMTDKQYYKLLNDNKKIDKELKKEKNENAKKYLKIRKEKNLKNIEKLKNDIQEDSKKSYIFRKRAENIREKYLKKIVELEKEKEELYKNLKSQNRNYDDKKNGLYNINHLQYIYEKSGIKDINIIEKEYKNILDEMNKNSEIMNIENEIKDRYSNYQYSKIIEKISELDKTISELQKENERENLNSSEKKYYSEWLKREEKNRKNLSERKKIIDINTEKKLNKELSKSSNPKIQEREKIKAVLKNIEAIKIIHKEKINSKRGEKNFQKWKNKGRHRNFNFPNHSKNSESIGGDFRMKDMELLDELER